MKPETVHLYALISLRAAASYDPAAFRRSTDLSPRDIDDRILAIEESLPEHADDTVSDASRQFDHLRSIEAEWQTQPQLGFLLRHLAESSMEHAHWLALRFANERLLQGHQDVHPATFQQPQSQIPPDTAGEIFRLGVMRLLRVFPDYETLFDFVVRNVRIDSVLRPHVWHAPSLFILCGIGVPPQQIRRRLRDLKKAAGRDRSILRVLLVTAADDYSALSGEGPTGGVNVLIYDHDSNEFAEDTDRTIRRAALGYTPKRGA